LGRRQRPIDRERIFCSVRQRAGGRRSAWPRNAALQMREDPLDHGRIIIEKFYGRKIEFTSLGSETRQDADSYKERQQHRNFNRIRDDAKDRKLNRITGRISEQDQSIRDFVPKEP
jgi:hypothetical protein